MPQQIKTQVPHQKIRRKYSRTDGTRRNVLQPLRNIVIRVFDRQRAENLKRCIAESVVALCGRVGKEVMQHGQMFARLLVLAAQAQRPNALLLARSNDLHVLNVVVSKSLLRRRSAFAGP